LLYLLIAIPVALFYASMAIILIALYNGMVITIRMPGTYDDEWSTTWNTVLLRILSFTNTNPALADTAALLALG
jgi:hypothetical protein